MRYTFSLSRRGTFAVIIGALAGWIARRLKSIDFCGTPYEWELQWTSEHRWHQVLSIYAGTWRGRVLARLDRWTHYYATGDKVVHGDPRQERSSD